jgi:protein-S-isoprenylcysteine O-methyltransferase Ste14
VLVYAVAIAGGVALSFAGRRWPLLLGTPWRIAAAVVLGIAALALAATTLVLFRRSGQNPLPWTPTPALLTSGPYQFSRNPMYVAATILQVAIGLGCNNTWIILLSGVALAVVHVVAVRPEETYLREKFGDAYRDYAARVRRYL